MSDFRINSNFQPNGDQPSAIRELSEGIIRGDKYQTLLGVTGSGKLLQLQMLLRRSKNPP